MASVDHPGLWSFATLDMPNSPQGPYQTVGTLLKIAGWIRLVMAGLSLVFGVVALLMLLIAGAIGGAVLRFMPFDPIAGLPFAMMLFVMLIVMVVVVAVWVAFLYWTSWIYAKWVGQDPRALQHVFIYAIVTIVVSGLGALGGMGGNPMGLIEIGLLVIGILLLIESRKPELEGFCSPVPPQPAGHSDVE